MCDIFKYYDVVDFLNATYDERRKRNPRFSLRSWCRQLGLDEAASMSLVLSRKRALSKRVSESLKTKLLTRDDERNYFDIITLATNAKDEDEKSFFLRLAKEFSPKLKETMLDYDQFQTISHWYNFVILEMTKLSDFSEEPEWIRRKLHNRATVKQITESLQRLQRLGYLRRDANGKLQRSQAFLNTTSDIPNAALRSLHKDFINLAFESLEKEDISKRSITGFHTVSTREKMAEAKVMIDRFREQLMNFLEVPEGDAIYQVNVQMFDLVSRQQ